MLYTKNHITIEDYINRIVRKFRLITSIEKENKVFKLWSCLRCGRVNERFYLHCQECGYTKFWKG